MGCQARTLCAFLLIIAAVLSDVWVGSVASLPTLSKKTSLAISDVDNAVALWTNDSHAIIARESGEITAWIMDEDGYFPAEPQGIQVCKSINGMATILGATSVMTMTSAISEILSVPIASNGTHVRELDLDNCVVSSIDIISASAKSLLGFTDSSLSTMAMVTDGVLAISSATTLSVDSSANALSRRIVFVDTFSGSPTHLIKVDLSYGGVWDLFPALEDNAIGILQISGTDNSTVMAEAAVFKYNSSNVLNLTNLADYTTESLTSAFSALPAIVQAGSPFISTSLSQNIVNVHAVSFDWDDYLDHLLLLESETTQAELVLYEESPTSRPTSKPTVLTLSPTPEPTLPLSTTQPTGSPSYAPTPFPTPHKIVTSAPTSASLLPEDMQVNFFAAVLGLSALTCCCGFIYTVSRRCRASQHHRREDDGLGEFEMIDEPMFDSFLEGQQQQQRRRRTSFGSEEVAVI